MYANFQNFEFKIQNGHITSFSILHQIRRNNTEVECHQNFTFVTYPDLYKEISNMLFEGRNVTIKTECSFYKYLDLCSGKYNRDDVHGL